MGLPEVGVKLVLRGLVVEGEDGSDRVLASASPVLRDAKPSMGGIRVCALGHRGGYQRGHIFQAVTPNAYLCYIAVWICPLYSCKSPEPIASRARENFWKRKPVVRPGDYGTFRLRVMTQVYYSTDL